ncbi:MAG: DNA recombination protein RmuC [Candidatus Poribacteria bacterium]|nr:DNA recombination protein RmuC [Candidatus Poribacteria bacterium]
MIETLIWVVVGLLLAVNLVLVLRILYLMKNTDSEKGEKAVQDEMRSLRNEVARSEREIRDEVRKGHDTTTKMLMGNIGEFSKVLTTQVEGMRNTVETRLTELTNSNETRIETVRATVDTRLQDMQTSNENKLEQMRKTVDDQLQSTLEKRLGESFNLVSERLEAVQHGLGEMQNLATGVGDLQRVLTNVKSQGAWGEFRLGTLLENVLSRDQYDTDVRTNENSQDVVEYAIRLPGRDDEPGSCVWLPIDSKFPLADYDKLVEARHNNADKTAKEKASKAFEKTVRTEAKKIHDKYIAPPKTTNFAIMFVPTEGLYAEVLQSPDLVNDLQRVYQIVVTGPTTLAALLNSLRMGFQTLAIEKRSSEVWEILAAVKTEFGKFGAIMDKLERQLNTASNTVGQTKTRTRAMERQLQTVEALPADESTAQLELPPDISEFSEDIDAS